MKKRALKLTAEDMVIDSLVTVSMIVLIVVMLYPVVVLISISLSDVKKLAFGNVLLLPRGFTLEAYEMFFSDTMLPRYYLNSVFYAAAGTVFSLCVCTMMGYGLTLKPFFAGKVIMVLMVITMYFGGGLIPTYLLVRSLGLVNNVLVMIIPWAFGAWTVVIIRTFFNNLPKEIAESAYMDGANDLMVLFRIVLPMSKALLATLALFSIVGSWNGYFVPMVYLSDKNLWPVILLYRRILVQMEMWEEMARYQATFGIEIKDLRTVRAAAIVVATVPIMCIYPFFQKYFTKGIVLGSLKG